MAVVLFCQCGSDRVDVGQWNGSRARLHCYTCGREAWLDGFTVSEFDPAKLFAASLIDQARKHRKRSPEENGNAEANAGGRPMTDAASYIFQRQVLWAQRKGITLCGSAGDRGRLAYTRTLNDNLFEPLSPEANSEYASGDGGELGRKVGRPGKMQALHSSSALGCNMFHYWRRIDHSAILRACGLPTRGVEKIVFEGQLPISEKFRYAPNLDVLVSYADKDVAAIECKFSEPFSTRTKVALSEKYLDGAFDALWAAAPTLRSLATLCANPSAADFTHVDVPQLLKHLLGLRRRAGARGHLLYLYYDVPGRGGVKHLDEISRFADAAARDGVHFASASHQALLLKLAEQRPAHAEWVDYMAGRYL